MENSENKKAPEELAEETLDKVAGGEGDFVGLNCRSCRHYDPVCPSKCPYGSTLDAVMKLKPSYGTQCPKKEA